MTSFTYEEIRGSMIPKLKACFFETKDAHIFNRALCDIFSQSKNPYVTSLDLVRASPDYVQPKGNSMSASVLREFERWLSEVWKDDAKKKRRLLTLDVRHQAYDVCGKKHTHLLAKATEIFELADIGELFLDDVRHKAEQGQHKDAVNCIISLGLQEFFKLSDVLIPCILQDKTAYFEAYVENQPEMQMELVRILDSICLPDPDIARFLEQNNIRGVQRHKISVKPLAKLIARILKKYNIPSEHAPNFTRTRSQGALRYLLVRRYVEKSIGVVNFCDMVHQAVECQPALAVYLLDMLCANYSDFNEALKWAHRLCVPKGQWPLPLAKHDRQNPGVLQSRIKDEHEVDDAPNPAEYLQLPIQIENVFIVDNQSELDDAIEQLKLAPIVGLDAEYQPSFGQPIEKVALLQVATKEKVFLFDVMSLVEKIGEEKLKEFVENVLCGPETLKLGFHFGADLKILALTLPCCSSLLSKMTNTICMETLITNLRKQNPNFMTCQGSLEATLASLSVNDENATSSTNGLLEEEKAADDLDSVLFDMPNKFHQSLSDVCKYFMGKPLNKNEQISNWCRRPLRQSQVVYAALDAICLLEVYDRAEKLAHEMNLDFKTACTISLVNSTEKVDARFKTSKSNKTSKNATRAEMMEIIKRVEEKRLKMQQNKAENNSDETAVVKPAYKSVKEISVIVDTMLQGLGKQLRRCGIDCKITENGKTADFVVETAAREYRMALSCGSSYTTIAARLPAELCCSVPNGLNSKLQLEWFLHRQNIKVEEIDIFSRCIICNSNDFMVIPSDVFCTLWDSKIAPTDFVEPVPFDKELALKRIDECLDELGVEKPEYGNFFIEESFTFCVNNFALNLLTGNLVRLDGVLEQQNTMISIEKVPGRSVFEDKNWFYLCASCGKVYWDGAHMSRYAAGMGFELHENGLSKF